jgi:AcrR family transcriptional regulator
MAAPAGRRGEARARVVRAALALFAEHGVNGTSLQMIADELGVTKAAVYHQFQTKEDIVLAVFRPVFDDLAALVATASAAPTPATRTDAALRGLADLVVNHRRLAAVFHGDPAIARLIRDDAELQTPVSQLGPLLTGPDPTPADKVAVSILGGGLMQSGVDDLLADVDDETLRRELLASARRLLRLDDRAGPTG